MRPSPRVVRLVTLAVVIGALSACRGCAGKEEMAFCDAVERGDMPTAQALFDSGRLNMLARNSSRSCQPFAKVFESARPQSAQLTAMAVTLTKREGMANTCWTATTGSSRQGASGAGQVCPIQAAARNANPVVMRALVDAGVTLTDHVAHRAVSDLVPTGSVEVMQILIDAGAERDYALMSAIAYRSPELIAYLEGKGAREDADPLLVAARKGDLAAVDAAIARRPDLEMQDKWGRTPLMRAAVFGRAAAVTRLAKAGAKLDSTVEGHTALFATLGMCDGPRDGDNHGATMMKALVAAGVDPARKNAEGETPSDVLTKLLKEVVLYQQSEARRACLQAKLDYLKSL
jgi:Ankyrin repeats (3 copies)